MPHARPARRRLARKPDRGDHRRPGADGRQRALDRRHGHRRQRDAAGRLQPARASRTSVRPARSLQHPVGHGRRRDHARARLRAASESRSFSDRRRHVRRVRGPGQVSTVDLDAARRPRQVASTRARSPFPGFTAGRLVPPDLQRLRLLRHRQADPRLHRAELERPPLQGARAKVKIDEHQPDLRGARRQDPSSRISSRTSTRSSRTSGAFVERISTFSACPACGGTRLNAAARSSLIDGRNIADACAMQISDLADWSCAASTTPSVAPARSRRSGRASTRSSRSASAT